MVGEDVGHLVDLSVGEDPRLLPALIVDAHGLHHALAVGVLCGVGGEDIVYRAAEVAPVEVLRWVGEDRILRGGLEGDVADGDLGVAGAGDNDGEELVEDRGDARGGEDQLVVVGREGDWRELREEGRGGLRGAAERGGGGGVLHVDRQVGSEGVGGEKLLRGGVRGVVEGEVVEDWGGGRP